MKTFSTQQKGLSLVELMVAMVLGLFLIIGIGHLFLATNKTWTLQDELSRIQENARMALNLLSNDIRTSAFTGCPAQAELANNLSANNDAREWMAHFDKGILGISSGTEAQNRMDSKSTSEAIIVHSIDRESETSITSHDASSAALTTKEAHGHDEGDLLAVISNDCEQVAVFQAGSNTSGSTVTHPANTSGELVNCISHTKGDYNCHTNTVTAEPMNHRGSLLAPLKSYAYYLRDSNNIPTLYRKKAGESINGNALSAEALVEGIEGLKILYGLDSNDDGVINQYRSAEDLGLFSDDWKKVTAIKLELLARSLNEVAPQPQPYFFGGQRFEPEDRYIRRNFITTIELRNRL